MIRTSDAVDTIIKAVTPFTGEFMARSATEAHCRQLGLVHEEVSADDLEKLLSKLGSALNVFIGREKSALVVADLHKTFHGKGVSR